MTNWLKAIEEFQEIRVQREINLDQENTDTPPVFILVVWEYIGEGYVSDFDPEDLDDVPLLRFSVLKSNLETGSAVFSEVDDGSYCTLMPVNTPSNILELGANRILDQVAHNIAVESFYKRDLERLSWMEPSWFAMGGEL